MDQPRKLNWIFIYRKILGVVSLPFLFFFLFLFLSYNFLCNSKILEALKSIERPRWYCYLIMRSYAQLIWVFDDIFLLLFSSFPDLEIHEWKSLFVYGSIDPLLLVENCDRRILISWSIKLKFIIWDWAIVDLWFSSIAFCSSN